MEQELAKYEIRGRGPRPGNIITLANGEHRRVARVDDDGVWVEVPQEGEPLPVKPPKNRSPRWKSRNNFWELRQLKALWLRSYRACASIETSCERVGRDVRSFYRWTEQDAEFKAAYLDIKRMWEEVRGEVVTGKLVDLDLKATEIVAAALDSKDEELRTATAMKLLKAHGRLVEKQVVVQEGEVKVIHTVEVIQPKEAP